MNDVSDLPANYCEKSKNLKSQFRSYLRGVNSKKGISCLPLIGYMTQHLRLKKVVGGVYGPTGGL